MATLVSPGVSVTVTNTSFFIPATAPTVPLFFIATADQKTQSDGTSPAEGTYENNVIRTVTSLTQSTQLYGVPRFLADPNTGAPYHGDARNEYGLFAVNQFLSVGSLAYVIRANVNLDDTYADIVTLWNSQITAAGTILTNNISNYLLQYNTTNSFIPNSPATAGYKNVNFSVPVVGTGSIGSIASQTYTATITINGIPNTITVDLSTLTTFNSVLAVINTQLAGAGVASIVAGNIRVTSATTGSTSTVAITDPGISPSLGIFSNLPNFSSFVTSVPGVNGYRTTVMASELLTLVATSTASLFNLYSFRNLSTLFIGDQHVSPFLVYGNGFSSSSTGTYDGLTWIANNISIFTGFPGGATIAGEFTPSEGGQLLLACGDDFSQTTQFLNATQLGANDAARRVAITTALISTINSNTSIRSENFQYNLILCPGYWECVPAMTALTLSINEEAFIIADTPNYLTPDGISNPSTGWAQTMSRVLSNDVAYYYPWGLSTNLDGSVVMVAPSGIACYTYAFSDNASYVWFAPAGVTRGIIDPNITDLGYASGTLGGPTTFVEALLNQGQRDALYQYAASGGINPLVFFSGTGFLVWGQKTSTGVVASALDRVNVTRLIMYIRRQLRINALPFVFEPNDTLTQNNLKAMVDSFLQNLMALRALYDFVTVCNSTNNPPSVVQANEMFIDVALDPEKAGEFIYIPIRVVATGSLSSSS